MIILVPFLIALIGLLMYALCSNPRLVEIGRIMFAVGLLAGLLRINAAAVSLLR